jgi:hypothetical protein
VWGRERREFDGEKKICIKEEASAVARETHAPPERKKKNIFFLLFKKKGKKRGEKRS